MSLAATFTANFSDFNAALEAASRKMEGFQVPVGNVERQLRTLETSFSGANILREADAIYTAINNLGGPSTLTAREMENVRNKVGEAIEKYQALGQEVPPHLQDLYDKTSAVKSATDDAEGSTSRWNTVSGAIASTIGNLAANAISSLVSGMGQAVGNVIDLGGQFTDLSAKTGLSTTAIQGIKFAMEQTGGSMDTAGRAVLMMSRKLAGGDDSAAQAAETLGVSFTDLRGLSPEEAFFTLADAIRNVDDPMAQAKIATDLFGKAGVEMLPAINDAGGGMRAMAERAGELGLIMSEDAVAAADDLGDTWDVLKGQGTMILAEVIGPFVPMIVSLATTLADLARLVMPYVRDGLNFLIEAFLRAKEKIADFLASVLEGVQKVPLLGDHLGIAGDAAGFFRGQAQNARDALAEMNSKTDEGTTKAPRLTAAVTEVGGAAAEAAKKAAEFGKAVGSLMGQDIVDRGLVLVRQIEAAGGASEVTSSKVAETRKALEDAIRVMEERGDTPPQKLRDLAFELGQSKEKVTSLQGAMLTLMPALTVPDAVIDGLDLARALPTNDEMASAGQKAMSGLVASARAAGEDVSGELGKAAEKASTAMRAKFTDFGSRLGGTILDAITGGGDIGETIGGFVGNEIGSGLQGQWNNLTSGSGPMAGAFSGGLGSMLGGVVGAVLPGVGALLGAGFSAITDKLFKGEEKRVNDMRDQFVASAGGIEELNLSASRAGVTLDRLLDAKKTNDFKAAQEELTRAIEAHETALADMDAALQRTLGDGSLLTQDLIGQMQKLFARDPEGAQESIFKFLQGEIALVTQGFTTAVASWSKDMTGGGASVERFSILAVAAFHAAIEAGASTTEALAAIGPGLATLSEKAAALGVSGGDAFGELSRLSGLSGRFGDLLGSVSGLGDMMTGLANTGLLTQSTFDALTDQVTATYQAMVDGGASAEDAMRLLQPELQEIWRLENEFGLTTQGATLDLQDQAFQSGIVGDKFQDAQTRMANAVNALLGRFDIFLSKMMGIPTLAETSARDAGAAWDGLSLDGAGGKVFTLGSNFESLGGSAQVGVGRVNEALSAVNTDAPAMEVWDLENHLWNALPGAAAGGRDATNSALKGINTSDAGGKLFALGSNLESLGGSANVGIDAVNDAFDDVDVAGVQDAVHDIDWEFERGIPDATSTGVALVNRQMDLAESAIVDVDEAAGDVTAAMTTDIPHAADIAEDAIRDLSENAVDLFGDMEDAAAAVDLGHSPTGMKQIRAGSSLTLRALRDLADGAGRLFGGMETASSTAFAPGRLGAVAPVRGALSSAGTGLGGGTTQQTIHVYLDGRQIAATVVEHMPSQLSVYGVA